MKAFTPLLCLGPGAPVNFIGSPVALPCCGTVDRFLQADLELGKSLIVPAVCILGCAFLFAIVPISIAIVGAAAKPMLERINRILVCASDLILPWLMLALEMWLIYDVARYFSVGP